MKQQSHYYKLNQHLKKMQSEYVVNPSEELKERIYKVDSSLKYIDASLGRWTTPGGNYKSSLDYKRFDLGLELKRFIYVFFESVGIIKLLDWLSKKL